MDEKAKCKKCEKDVSIWEMELDPMWTCYDCLDKEENNLSLDETDIIINNAMDKINTMNKFMGGE